MPKLTRNLFKNDFNKNILEYCKEELLREEISTLDCIQNTVLILDWYDGPFQIICRNSAFHVFHVSHSYWSLIDHSDSWEVGIIILDVDYPANKWSDSKSPYEILVDHQFTHDIYVVARDVEDGVTYHYRVDNLAHLHLNGFI